MAMDGRWPRAGRYYPRSTGEFQSWFATDADCLDYLEWLRWQDGFSALSLQRALEIGSYPTAWAMLHRLRSVLVRPGRDRLTGIVEVDETYIGGEEPGLRGGRARGKKSLVGVAVEVKQPRGYGRCRMAILADASAASLHPVRHRERRARQHRHHRRLAGLPRHRQARLHPRPAQPA